MLRMLLTFLVLLWIEAARFLLVCIVHAKHAAPRNYFADDSLGGLFEKKKHPGAVQMVLTETWFLIVEFKIDISVVVW